MNVDSLMTRDPDCCSPGDSIRAASARMKGSGVGMLPVTEEGRPLGVITDRDVCMAVADGRPDTTAVEQIMSRPAICCGQWERPRAALETMRDKHVRRLVVVDESGSVTGVVALDDLAAEAKERVHEHVPSHSDVVETLRAVSRYRDLQPVGT
jgi:CBS domain-containing protein